MTIAILEKKMVDRTLLCGLISELDYNYRILFYGMGVCSFQLSLKNVLWQPQNDAKYIKTKFLNVVRHFEAKWRAAKNKK